MFSLIAEDVWTRTPARGSRLEREKWRPIVGSKALGLLVLPAPWTPQYLVVGTALYRKWSSLQDPEKSNLIAVAAEALNRFIPESIESADHGLVIRSSAVKENMA